MDTLFLHGTGIDKYKGDKVNLFEQLTATNS